MRLCLMNNRMMIWAYYHKIIVIVIHGENEWLNVMNLDDSPVIWSPKIVATNLTFILIKRLKILANGAIEFPDFY